MSQREAYPIKSLEDILNWQSNPSKYAVEPLRKCVQTKDAPRTLLCHDMMGGYLDDRFNAGVKKSDCYRFFHWSSIDIFVYFSHYFVTIPPSCWINAGHINSCLVLGTFITESDEGENICQEIFTSRSSVDAIVSKLVNIAIHYGFDGWLLNIENKIQEKHMGHLRDFVFKLTEKMHKALPNSLIIWYDSVTENGELKWQNALNEKNRLFFDVSDGIFLNYTWTNEHLEKSLREAGSRVKDVFVGVDVFGRGCLGDGGFCTNIAVEKARSYGFSVAIFAPGWVYETLPKENFTENQYKFWDLLSDFCPPHGPAELPLVTSFCQGFGHKLFKKGKIVHQNPWTNLSLQQIQPTFHYNKAGFTENTLSVYTEAAYDGGGCLKFSCPQKPENELHIFRFFICELEMQGSTAITYTIQPLSPMSDLILLLEIIDVSQRNKFVLLSNDKSKYEDGQPKSKIRKMNNTIVFDKLKILKMLKSKQDNISEESHVIETLAPVSSAEEEKQILQKISKAKSRTFKTTKYDLDETIQDNLGKQWITRIFLMDHSYKNHKIVNISASVSYKCSKINDPVNILLGQMQIIPLEDELNETSVIPQNIPEKIG